MILLLPFALWAVTYVALCVWAHMLRTTRRRLVEQGAYLNRRAHQLDLREEAVRVGEWDVWAAEERARMEMRKAAALMKELDL